MLCTLRRHEAKHIASLPTMQGAYIPAMEKSRPKRPYRLHRLARLTALRDEAGGPKELARQLYGRDDANDTHLIACLKGRRDVGDDLASDLESTAGKPPGWMDSNPALDIGERSPSDRAAEIARQLDAVEDAETRTKVMILCANLVELAQAGRLDQALSVLQALAPARSLAQPTPQPDRHPSPQSGGDRAARA